MKIRFLYTLIAALALCAFMSSAVLADDGIVFYDDTEAHRPWMEFKTGGLSYVNNGDFSIWTTTGPDKWMLDTSGITGKGHFAKMNFSAPDDHALGLFLKNEGSKAAGSAVAYSELQIPAAGHYWVAIHGTAWSHDLGGYDAVAWYAIYPTKDPASVPDSEWRELLWGPCPNKDQICSYIGREELRHIEPGSYIFLKGAVKYPAFHGWTVFGWDDVAVWKQGDGWDGPGEPVWTYPDAGWILKGDVTWDRHAIR